MMVLIALLNRPFEVGKRRLTLGSGNQQSTSCCFSASCAGAAGNTSRRNFLAVSALAAAAATIPVIPAARAASPDQELMDLGAKFFSANELFEAADANCGERIDRVISATPDRPFGREMAHRRPVSYVMERHPAEKARPRRL